MGDMRVDDLFLIMALFCCFKFFCLSVNAPDYNISQAQYKPVILREMDEVI